VSGDLTGDVCQQDAGDWLAALVLHINGTSRPARGGSTAAMNQAAGSILRGGERLAKVGKLLASRQVSHVIWSTYMKEVARHVARMLGGSTGCAARPAAPDVVDLNPAS
jgi:hypothetical protein